MRSNIYLASDRQRPEQEKILRDQWQEDGKVWPRPRDRFMGQIPDMYYVSWHSLTNEGKVRADVELAEKLGIGLMQYDWEPRIAVPKPGGTEIRVPPTSYSHLSREQEEESDNIWQKQVTNAGDWIHDQARSVLEPSHSNEVQWGVYDLPVTFGDKNLQLPKEVQSVEYNARRCMHRLVGFGEVVPGALAAVDYASPVLYRPWNFSLERAPDWRHYVEQIADIVSRVTPDYRLISWVWPFQHPSRVKPAPEWPPSEWEEMLAIALSVGDVIVHCEHYDELSVSRYASHQIIYDQWNRSVAYSE